MPPGPTRVTRRTSSRRSRASTSVDLGIAPDEGGRRDAAGAPAGTRPRGRCSAVWNRSLSRADEVVGEEPLELLGRLERLVRHAAVADPLEHLLEPRLAVRGRALQVHKLRAVAGRAAARPRDPRSPCRAPPSRTAPSRSPTNTWLCSRYARYSSCGGWGRAPSSNSTGMRCSASIARLAAARSAASSSRVDDTNTRTRWSGVRIAGIGTVWPSTALTPRRGARPPGLGAVDVDRRRAT